jgi:hypothetical protein
MSDLQTQIDSLRGELREEKEYGAALEESKRDAEHILSKKIAELTEARKRIEQLEATALQDGEGEGHKPETQYRIVVRQAGETIPLGIEQLGSCAERLKVILADADADGTEIEDAWAERRTVTYGSWERALSKPAALKGEHRGS